MPYVEPILAKLREVTAGGIEVHYLAGNRDFNFDARVNGGPPPRELPESLGVESCGRQLFLTHGDLLCTGDRDYRRVRSLFRSWPMRATVSHMPLGLSIFLSRGYRRLSKRAVARKPRRVMAVDFARVRSHLLRGYDMVVSGHVHRGARYRVDLPGGRKGEFVTLGDWSRAGVYLVSRADGLRLRKFL
jgi:UDP-2,3-diacylglucosamine hydrolase